jgi:hypothetical protein
MAPQDLMHPVLSPQQARFIDAEVSLLGDRICGNTTQNSHLKLIEAVGGWAGDDKPLDLGSGLDRVPPTLTLADPAPGAVVAQPLALRVEASDEAGIDRVTLLTPEGETVVRRPPFGFSLAGFPPGPLSFTLTAYDRSGNSATLSRAVTVTATPELPGCQAAPGRPQNAGAALPICVIVLATTFAGRRRRVSPRSCCRAGSSPL